WRIVASMPAPGSHCSAGASRTRAPNLEPQPTGHSHEAWKPQRRVCVSRVLSFPVRLQRLVWYAGKERTVRSGRKPMANASGGGQLNRSVLAVVAAIPEGRVTTYGVI